MTAEFVETTGNNLHVYEVVEHIWIPLARCIEMIFAQQIVDSLSIVGLLAYYTRTFVKQSAVGYQL